MSQQNSSQHNLQQSDARARRAAQQHFTSPLILEAGAGTGKTTSLVNRIVVWLLGEGWERSRGQLRKKQPEASVLEIASRAMRRSVGITFTERAAAEMAMRTTEALAQLEAGTKVQGLDESLLPDPDRRRLRAEAYAVAASQLTLRTIHGFCKRILTAYPLEAGLHPRFQVDADGKERNQLVRGVVTGLLERYAGQSHDPFRFLTAHGVSPHGFAIWVEEALESGMDLRCLEHPSWSLSQRDQRIAAFQQRTDQWLAAVGDAFATSKLKRSSSVVTAIRACDELCQQSSWRDDFDFEKWLVALREPWDDNSLGRLRNWSKAKFTKGEFEGLDGRSQLFASLSAELLSDLLSFLQLDYGALEKSRDLLHQALEACQQELQRSGLLSFDGLLRSCRSLLQQHPSICRELRLSMDQLLVDEFQDTDPVQCDIIELLALRGDRAERPSLMLVGDPKQSIYGWRNADLGAYHRFVEKLVGEGARQERLSINFRSNNEILHEVEQVIAPSMRQQPAVQPAFEPLIAAPSANSVPGKIEYWLSWSCDEQGIPQAKNTRVDDANALEAKALARDLARLRDSGHELGEVAVLFRAASDMPAYLAELREWGIPYQTQHDQHYYQRREICDATALIRSVLDPNDLLSLIAWLRSPAVGVPDAAWIPLFAAGIPAAIRDAFAVNDGSEAEAFEKIRACAESFNEAATHTRLPEGWEESLCNDLHKLMSWRRLAQQVSAVEWLATVRDESQLEQVESARYFGAYRLKNLQRFFAELLTQLEENAGSSHAVLVWLEQCERDTAKSRANASLDPNRTSVSMMTIHAAKGLGFEHVYLMQTHKGAARSKASGWQYGELEEGSAYQLGDWESAYYSQVRAHAIQRDAAEQVRSLYVALTRAKYRLVIAGVLPEQVPVDAQSASFSTLLAARADGWPDLAEKARSCAQLAQDRFSWNNQCWRFLGLSKGEAEASRPTPQSLGVTPQQIFQDESVLSEYRQASQRSMAKAWSMAMSTAAADEEALAKTVHPVQTELFVKNPTQVTGQGQQAAGGAAEIAAQAGTLVHRILEEIDLTQPLAPALEEAIKNCGHWVKSQDAAQAAAITERAQFLLQTFLSGPLFERFSSIAPFVVARELPILRAASEKNASALLYRGSIDLVYRNSSQQEFVVVDYKSDWLEDPEGDPQRLAKYRRQLAAYAEALASAFHSEEKVVAELWFIYSGKILTCKN